MIYDDDSFTEKICILQVEFKMNQVAISGLKVNRLDMYNEVGVWSQCLMLYNWWHLVALLQRFKPFKGIKYITKSGKFQIRS